MCKLCETPELLGRLDRVIKALDGSSSVNPEAIRLLLVDARSMLGTHYQAQLAQRLIMTGNAAMEVVNLDEAPPPGALH